MLINRHQIMADTKWIAGMDSSIYYSHHPHRGKGMQLRADIVGDVRYDAFFLEQ
jgi:hypothetical protein